MFIKRLQNVDNNHVFIFIFQIGFGPCVGVSTISTIGDTITLALNNMIYWQIQTCHNQSNQYLAIQPHLVLQPHAVVTVPG